MHCKQLKLGNPLDMATTLANGKYKFANHVRDQISDAQKKVYAHIKTFKRIMVAFI